MLLRVRIRELLCTALLEAPPNVNTRDQEKWGPIKGPRKYLGAMAPLTPPRRNATGGYVLSITQTFYSVNKIRNLNRITKLVEEQLTEKYQQTDNRSFLQ